MTERCCLSSHQSWAQRQLARCVNCNLLLAGTSLSCISSLHCQSQLVCKISAELSQGVLPAAGQHGNLGHRPLLCRLPGASLCAMKPGKMPCKSRENLPSHLDLGFWTLFLFHPFSLSLGACTRAHARTRAHMSEPPLPLPQPPPPSSSK